MKTNRLEAFSDGVLAIIITIMVLDLKRPEEPSFEALRHTTGTAFLSYLLSFVFIGIYWNNHHHMFQLVRHITGGVLWANLALLFSLSLLPFTTSWMDETDFTRTPVVTYGINLLASAVAYYVLQTTITRSQGRDSALRAAVGQDLKGKLSPVMYIAGILSAAFIDRGGRFGVWLGFGFFVAVAVMWLVPDRRIERTLREPE